MIIQERILSRGRHASGESEPMQDLELQEVDIETLIGWVGSIARGSEESRTLKEAQTGELVLQFHNGAGVVTHEIVAAGDDQEHAAIILQLGPLAVDDTPA